MSWPDLFRPIHEPRHTSCGLRGRRHTSLSSGRAHGAVCTLNALLPEQHTGSGGNSSGRRGRIKGSVNLPAAHLLDSATNEFLPAAEVRRRFEAVGAFGKQAITYCGGSIAASADAFALVMLDHPDVKLYGASLSEWAIDPTLPMETG